MKTRALLAAGWNLGKAPGEQGDAERDEKGADRNEQHARGIGRTSRDWIPQMGHAASAGVET
jgi:hypothetical protein